MVEAVIFDWGGTLTPWHTIDPLECWQAITQDPELAARLLAAENAAWTRARDEHRSARLAEVIAAAPATLTAMQMAAYEKWWEPHTYTDPEAPALFAGLRDRGLKIGLLSNTIWSREVHERILARDGVLEWFDGSVYTSEIPWTKPHPEAFRAALDAVGISDARKAVFVGDRPFDDIYGAKSVGMRAVFLPHSDIPSSQRGWIEGEPDAVIRSLPELIDVLDAWEGDRRLAG